MKEKKKRDYRFSIIPEYIKKAKDLNSTEKLLYGEILSLSESKGYCYANNYHFEIWYSLSKSTVTQSISKLQKLNYIYCQYGRGNSRKIYILSISDRVVIRYRSSQNLPLSIEDLPDLSLKLTTAMVESSHNNRKGIDKNKNEIINEKENSKSNDLRSSFSNKDKLGSILVNALSTLYNTYKYFDLESIIISIDEGLEKSSCKEDIIQYGLQHWLTSILIEDNLIESEDKIEEENFLALMTMYEDQLFEVLNS